MLESGDIVAGYEIVAELRSGGMATLYLGRRAGAGGFAKHVAIKVIHPHLGKDETFVRMFLDEANLAARIEHPNVVHTHDLGEQNGRYFMVMEYINGCSLAQLLKALKRDGRRMSVELATWLAIRVAAGLNAAHDVVGDDGRQLGVVHRDVSPQNVLLAYKGYVKLIDFGIAKAAGRSQQTATGFLKGKFRYMSPEQAAGQAVDRRTDIYALGVILWEMLTMMRCFDGQNDLQLLDQVRNPNIVPPSTHAPDIPPALEAVVMRCLSPDPAGRPASADELRRLLSTAVPSALSLDTKQLSELLLAVMQDEIEQERQSLPPSVSGVLLPPQVMQPPEDAGIVAELTQVSGKPVFADDPPAPRPPPAGARPVPAGGLRRPIPPTRAPTPAAMIDPPPLSAAPPTDPSYAPPFAEAGYPETELLDTTDPSRPPPGGVAYVATQALALPDHAIDRGPDSTPAPGTVSGVVAARSVGGSEETGPSFSNQPPPAEDPSERGPNRLGRFLVLTFLFLLVGAAAFGIATVLITSQDNQGISVEEAQIVGEEGPAPAAAPEPGSAASAEGPVTDAPTLVEAEEADAEEADAEDADAEDADAEDADAENADAENADAEEADTGRADALARRRARERLRRERAQQRRQPPEDMSPMRENIDGVPLVGDVMF